MGINTELLQKHLSLMQEAAWRTYDVSLCKEICKSVEEIRLLMNRANPSEVIKENNNDNYTSERCPNPNCGTYVFGSYCHECGQALKF